MSSENNAETSHLLPQNHHDDHGVRQLHEKVPLYSPPRQRQRWDETQILPHVNWGDLFFDLYYVAAAFQLSHAFQHNPTSQGLLYFVACFCPVVSIWNDKLVFDAKYAPDDNFFHRSMEIVHLCLLGTIVQHIQPAEIMADTIHNPTMFIFCISLLLDGIWQVYLNIDLFYNVDGGPEARYDSQAQVQRKTITTTVFLLATAMCAFDYFFHEEKAEEGNDDNTHQNFLPAYLLIFAFFFESILWIIVRVYIIIPSLVGSHKEMMVPMNLEFFIHRTGEWIMLMLGESVLSILTVETPQERSFQFAICTYTGLLTVTLFQYLYFRTQPTEAKDHAARRSRTRAIVNFLASITYSASLIMVGCSYKMILSSFGKEGDENKETTAEEEEEEEEHSFSFDMKEQIAKIFCRSLAISFLMLDFQLMSHRGWVANQSRLCPGRCRIAWIPFILSMMLIIIAILALNLSQWTHDPVVLSISGLLLVLWQVLVRTIGLRYFPISKEAMDHALKNTGQEEEIIV